MWLTFRWFLLLVLLPGLAMAGFFKHVKHEHWSNDYDHYFRKYTKHYFGPHIDWYWFKAQGIAESGLRPSANSPVGALGIMQIMPATYAEIKEKNPHFTHIKEPRWNIAAGIFYDRMLYRKWQKGLPTQERLAFAMASYNAGYGNILKAFRRAQGKVAEVKQWKQVAPYAPRETRHYVRRIKGLMETDQ
jgi:membrane-bound lytic murein transglycosylase F